MSIALTTTTSSRIGAGICVRPHTAVIHRLRLVGTSSAQRAWAAYSAAMGSLHRLHDNHVPSPGCLQDLATYFLNPTPCKGGRYRGGLGRVLHMIKGASFWRILHAPS